MPLRERLKVKSNPQLLTSYESDHTHNPSNLCFRVWKVSRLSLLKLLPPLKPSAINSDGQTVASHNVIIVLVSTTLDIIIITGALLCEVAAALRAAIRELKELLLSSRKGREKEGGIIWSSNRFQESVTAAVVVAQFAHIHKLLASLFVSTQELSVFSSLLHRYYYHFSLLHWEASQGEILLTLGPAYTEEGVSSANDHSGIQKHQTKTRLQWWALWHIVTDLRAK